MRMSHGDVYKRQGQAAAEEKGVAGQQEAETMETVSGKTTYTGQMSQTPHTPVSYTHLDVYKRQGLPF